MSNGRLERETIEFRKIEEKLKYLPSVFTDYYYTLRAEKKSYRTIGEYINSVTAFMKYCTDGKKDDNFYKNVTTMNINKYMITLETKKVGRTTKATTSGYRANKWKALNSFFVFLEETGEIEKNPLSQKSRPKVTDNPSVTFLTEEEVAGIIENIQEEAKDIVLNRDLCWFMLGVTTGLRAAAILQINMEDIDLEHGTIHVIEKMNKEFDVMLGTKAKKILKKWIADRNKYFKDADTNALFLSQWGDRMSYRTLRELLTKYSEGVTRKKVTPHVMRHTCATNLYEKTGDIYLTSAQLHHANVSITQRYADMSSKKLKKAASILDDLI